ncbi:hypothetical protein E2C01_015136 [Portunus trituberculatus]|uniref:Uncharacterized protein n=1 Tax=Portunus trituberculatus TaxID=210409 RepID=A0A5B7DM12_PORTR|nr:hypothetical protein [Portunus trituberculatus]
MVCLWGAPQTAVPLRRTCKEAAAHSFMMHGQARSECKERVFTSTWWTMVRQSSTVVASSRQLNTMA